MELRPATNRTRFGQALITAGPRASETKSSVLVAQSLSDERILESDELTAEPYEEPADELEEGLSPEPGQWHHQQPLYPPTPMEQAWGRNRRNCCPPHSECWHHSCRFWENMWGGHRDPDDPQRHHGLGEPLVGTSWRNRPWYVNGFLGGMIGDEIQAGLVDQGGGFIAGGRFGGDFDHYWGSEVRFAMSDVNLNYPNVVRSGQSRDTFFDGNLLYYPLGDTRWRPYISLGFGVGSFKYDDANGKQIHASALSLPFGGGLKYLLARQWAMRFDIINNFTWDSGSRADSMHNISFTGGVEYHFGGHTTVYGPW